MPRSVHVCQTLWQYPRLSAGRQIGSLHHEWEQSKLIGMTRSVLYQLIEDRLGCSLESLVADARPVRASWASIAADIHKRTGVEINQETLRLWFAEAERQSA